MLSSVQGFPIALWIPWTFSSCLIAFWVSLKAAAHCKRNGRPVYSGGSADRSLPVTV